MTSESALPMSKKPTAMLHSLWVTAVVIGSAVAQAHAADDNSEARATAVLGRSDVVSPQQASDKTASWLDEIIVIGRREGYAVPDSSSATRTDTPLIETPQSVQVINRTLIEEQDRRTLGDALVNVSGVTPTRSEEALLIPPIVRGFPAEVYLDGLPIFGGNQQAFNPASLVGVQRIEVLKGPSSTLYGGGLGSPLGGLINIESERPGDTFEGIVAMRAGSFSTFNPYGNLNVPLGSGVAARIAAEYQSNDSWIDRVEGKRWSAQPSLSFELDSKTELLVQGQINRTSQLEYSGLPAEQALAGELNRDAFPGAPIGQPRTRIDNQFATVGLKHEFTDDLKLSVSGRYYDSKIHEYGSFVFPAFYPPDPATPTTYPILPLNMLTTSKEGTFDANLLAKVDMLGGSHVWLAGVNYDRTKFYSSMGFSGAAVGDLDLADPSYDLSFGEEVPRTLTQTDRYQTIAAYLQDQANYGRLHLTGSLRYTQLNFREAEQVTDKTYHHVSPRFGATVDLLPGVAAYAGYATAFRGAFGFIGDQSPKPETSRNVEGGFKLAAKSIGLSGTIAVFTQTRDNVATPDPADPFSSIQTGKQRARGVEADLVWEMTPAFSLLANYAHTDAEVTKDTTIPVGDKLPRVPRDSGRIAARYRVLNGAAEGLSFGAGITALSSREDTLPNTVSVPGYAVVDAQASQDFGKFTVGFSALNLTGRKGYDTYQYFGFPVVMPMQPRSAYVTLKAAF
jgi:iron complex outermembrane receptor protein